MIDILNIGCGNITSINNWVEKSHLTARIVSDVSELKSNLLILPGVGSAGSFMARLKAKKFDSAIIEHVENGGRLLGICLGFQVMASSLEEDGGVEGLGLIDGNVERLKDNVSHNGWESITLNKYKMNGQKFQAQFNNSRKKILKGRVFYNHEFGFINDDRKSYSLPISEKFNQYSALVVKNNIIGMQFHPEKSQITGLHIISMIL